MANVKLYLRKSNEEEKTGFIWLSFYIKNERVHFSTKVKVDEKNWNENKEAVTSGDKKAKDKNLVLEHILARVNDVFVKYRLRDKEITRNLFMRAYHRPTDFNTFYDFVTAAMKKTSVRIELSTLLTHHSVISKMRAYAPDLTFDDITKEWLDDYYLYLRKELGNNDNTAYKNMAVLKKYVRMAYKDGYMDENPFDEWMIRKVKTNCVYLTEEELETLVDLYRHGRLEYKLHKTLEFFLFMCFSSLHIGDVKRLQLEQFTDTSFTYFRMKLRNRKPEPIVVPISNPLASLLREIVGPRKKGPVFESTQADQTMNRNLKEIAEIAGINKVLTHKVGRHTFATIYLRKTKDIASLREILGHSDISETLIYAHVLDESKQEGIQCFNSFAI